MKCLVIETSPERISAEPVTDENGTPHVYATMAEARAELRANGYSYNRENQRYYINGTEYRAYIIREDSEEYAEIMEQAEQEAAPEYIEPEATAQQWTAEDLPAVDSSANHAETWADAAEYAAKNTTPAEARICAEYAKAAAEDARKAARYDLIHYYSDYETSGYSAQAVRIQRADVERAEAAAKRAEEAAQRAEIIAELVSDPAAREMYLAHATAHQWTPAETRAYIAHANQIKDANRAARAFLDAYAGAIGEYPEEDDPETIAARRVAADDITRCSERATDRDRELVDQMVEVIAAHWAGSHDPEPRPTYQRAELETFLGDYADEYDADAIEAEATETDPMTGRTYWTPEAVRDLWSICERHELYTYAPVA